MPLDFPELTPNVYPLLTDKELERVHEIVFNLTTAFEVNMLVSCRPEVIVTGLQLFLTEIRPHTRLQPQT